MASVSTVIYDIKDKVILVTGGAAGIGAGIVQAFLEEGAKHVAALDLDVNNVKALENDMSKKYDSNRVKFYVCDVTTNDLEAAYSSVIADYGYIDIVVNCAGMMNDSPNVYLKEIAVNISALITSSFKAYDLMRKDHGGKSGTIINISSALALKPIPLVPVYSATKSAVLQFSTCLGMEPHYSRTGVRVITLCFGCTDTSIFDTNKMGAFDNESSVLLEQHIGKLYKQKSESAVKGLITAYKHGASGSTWLVTADNAAEDITAKVTEAYAIMSQGISS